MSEVPFRCLPTWNRKPEITATISPSPYGEDEPSVVHLAGWPCEMDEIMALARD